MQAMKAGQRKRVGVMICGKIRDAEKFLEDLAVYESWRSAGHVDRIVFTGWLSDLDENAGLIETMRKMGVQVHLASEPVFSVPGHMFHQMKCISAGIDYFEDDELVIKTRTDKLHLNFDIEEMIRSLTMAPPPMPWSPFSSRVIVVVSLALHPYFHNDMIFAGQARDLRKLVSFDLWFEMEHAAINAEQIMHSAPYIGRDKWLKAFFQVNPGVVHHSVDAAEKIQCLLLSDPLYQYSLCTSLLALRGNYVVGLNPSHSPFEAGSFAGLSLESLYRRVRSAPMDGIHFHAGAHTLELTRGDVISVMLQIPVSEAEPRSLLQLVNARDFPLCGQTPRGAADALASRLRDMGTDMHNLAIPRHVEQDLIRVSPRDKNIFTR